MDNQSSVRSHSQLSAAVEEYCAHVPQRKVSDQYHQRLLVELLGYGFCNLSAGGEDCIGCAACPRTRGSS